MRIRAFVCAAALAALVPAASLAQVTVTATVEVVPGDVAAGSVVQVACFAQGTYAGMLRRPYEIMERVDVTVTGGTVSPTQLTNVTTQTCLSGTGTCSTISGSVAWTTSSTPGAYSVTCTATYHIGTDPPLQRASAPAPLTTVPAAALPPSITAVTGPAEVAAGTATTYEAVATDPNVPPRPLTYAWTASGGTVTPDAANPARAVWEAPATRGTYQLTVAVSNDAGTSQHQRSVNVVFAAHQASLPLPLAAPRRLAADEAGALFVVDGQQGATGSVALATVRGEARGFATLPEPALAVARGAGVLWVTTTKGSIYRIDPVTGRNQGKLALAGGPFAMPAGIAYDAAGMRLWVADRDADLVRIITPDGATVATLTHANGARLLAPVDVAVDGASGRAWVLVSQPKPAPDAGEPVEVARFLHGFDLAGQHVGSFVTVGGALGQLTRAGGVTAGPAGVYLSDIYRGTVQVLAANGTAVATIGAFGREDGQLTNPMGLAMMKNGDLAVANTDLGRVDRFGSGAALPTCAGDADCDGLLDGWEIANGLNPGWAGDALLDLDGDGLNDAEEYAAGTSPRSVDSDGDGHSDPAELASGFDPANPADHLPAVSASGPAETPPGLVRLSAVVSGDGTCTVAWAQASGRTVALKDAATISPSFIARAAGEYAFDAVPSCNGVAGAAKRVGVRVLNVPPRPDGARVLVASPGSAVTLDAAAASDANGDALAFTWDQTLGPALLETQTGSAITARPRGAGLYAFQVAVADPAGASSTAEIPVLVTAGPAPTAIASANPAEGEVGSTVVLDASASVVEAGATYLWQQVAGATVSLGTPEQAVSYFVPPAPGRYAFDVTVASARLRSPPARVEVLVAPAGGALPTVTATAPAVVAVNTAVTLEATGSGGALEYAWRQVAGPAAGLTSADRATAAAVPFTAGFHVFEVAVKDAQGAWSRPYRVAFEAQASGRALPQARATVPGGAQAIAGQLVFLDGRASTGAARWRWTQVGGPWVALAAQTALTTFRPLVPGRYAFELEVSDGTVRGAPARVEVEVVAAPEGVQ